MRSRLNILPIFALLLLVAAVSFSCNNDTCLQNQSSIPKAQLYSSTSQKAITVDSLTIFGIGAPGDSMLVKCNKVSTVLLPLRPTTNITQFVIHYDQKILSDPSMNDTITFDCTPEMFYDSRECGAFYRFAVNKVTHTRHFIDSIAVLVPVFNNTTLETVKIFMITER